MGVIEETKEEFKLDGEEKQNVEEKEQEVDEKEEEEYVIEWMEKNENEFEDVKHKLIDLTKTKQIKRKRLSREKIIEEATTISALNTEIGLLIEVNYYKNNR